MGKLVSIQQARDHLRSDASDDDADLLIKVEAASELVLDYIYENDFAGSDFVDTNGDPDVDTSGDPIGVPYAVQAATLLMVGYLYRMRDNNDGSEYEYGYLPKPVISLLYRRRQHGIA